MTPKLQQHDNCVGLIGDVDDDFMYCDTPEQAAAIVLACNHFDDLLAAARLAKNSCGDHGTEAGYAYAVLCDVVAAIDKEAKA